MRLDDFLTLHGRPSRGEMHAGLLIDDFVLWEQVGFDTDLEQPTAGSMLVEEVRAAYLKVGLPRHPGKAVRLLANLPLESFGELSWMGSVE